MKTAIKYESTDLLYVYLKKHFCPECGEKLKTDHISKIVSSKSPEAKNYDFSNGDTFFAGDVEFRKICFCCKSCQRKYTEGEIKRIENHKLNEI